MQRIADEYDLFLAMSQAFEDRNFEHMLQLRVFHLQNNPDEYLEDRFLFQKAPFPIKRPDACISTNDDEV